MPVRSRPADRPRALSHDRARELWLAACSTASATSPGAVRSSRDSARRPSTRRPAARAATSKKDQQGHDRRRCFPCCRFGVNPPPCISAVRRPSRRRRPAAVRAPARDRRPRARSLAGSELSGAARPVVSFLAVCPPRLLGYVSSPPSPSGSAARWSARRAAVPRARSATTSTSTRVAGAPTGTPSLNRCLVRRLDDRRHPGAARPRRRSRSSSCSCGALAHRRASSLAGSCVELATYRVASLIVHRAPAAMHRGSITCPSNQSYPSGHIAASIAVYGGLALLVTSRLGSAGVGSRRLDARRRCCRSSSRSRGCTAACTTRSTSLAAR